MGSLTKPILLAVVGVLAVVLFLQTSNLITGMEIGNATHNAIIPTLVTTQNVAPTVYDVNFTMIAAESACFNDSTTIWCYGVVNDSNGWTNVTDVNATIWNMAAIGTSASCDATSEENTSNCYVNSSCMYNTTVDAAQRYYQCSFKVLTFFAENGTWNCTMWASDGQALATNDSGIQAGNKVRSELYALSINDSINWGSAAIGDKLQQTVFVQNCGNRPIDTHVNGTDMTCNVSSIGVANITYGLSASTATTALATGVPVEISTANVKPTDGNQNVTVVTYWNLSVPVGVGGSCIGNATFIAEES